MLEWWNLINDIHFILFFQYNYHLSPEQLIEWKPEEQPLSILPFEPQPILSPKKCKPTIIYENKENFVDLTQDSDDENETYSTLERTEATKDKVMMMMCVCVLVYLSYES